MTATLYSMRVVKGAGVVPAPQPQPQPAPAPTLKELRGYEADLEETIEQLSEGGLEYAADVMQLDQTRRAVYSEIAALTRGGKK